MKRNHCRTHEPAPIGGAASARGYWILAGTALAAALAVVAWASGANWRGGSPGTAQGLTQGISGASAQTPTVVATAPEPDRGSQVQPAQGVGPWSGLDRGQLERDWDVYCRADPRREWERRSLWEYLWPTGEEIATHRPRGGDPATEVEKTRSLVREALSADAVPDEAIRSAEAVPMDDWHNGSDFVAMSFETGGRLFRVIRGYVLAVSILPPAGCEAAEDPVALVLDTLRRWGAVADEDRGRLYAEGVPLCEGSPFAIGYLTLRPEKTNEEYRTPWCGGQFATDGRAVVLRDRIEQKREWRGHIFENSARGPITKVRDPNAPYQPPTPLEWF